MKTNHYESVVIINAALEDEHVDATLARIEEVITSNGGTITEVDKWGRKRLAYPIKKSKSGFYVVYRYTAPGDVISKLERTYRLDENVIRYLTIVLDKKAIEFYEKQKQEAQSDSSEVVPEESTQSNKIESKE